VTTAKDAFHRGADLPAENVTSFHKDYQGVVRIYGVGHDFFFVSSQQGLTLGLGKNRLAIRGISEGVQEFMEGEGQQR
jgi:hypothetical protein